MIKLIICAFTIDSFLGDFIASHYETYCYSFPYFFIAFLGIQGYKKYQAFKIKHLLNVWKKKYHPFPTKKRA